MCLLTFAGASVGRHLVAVGRTGTLVAALHVDALEGTQVAHTLAALVNVCKRQYTRALLLLWGRNLLFSAFYPFVFFHNLTHLDML